MWPIKAVNDLHSDQVDIFALDTVKGLKSLCMSKYNTFRTKIMIWEVHITAENKEYICCQSEVLELLVTDGNTASFMRRDWTNQLYSD